MRPVSMPQRPLRMAQARLLITLCAALVLTAGCAFLPLGRGIHSSDRASVEPSAVASDELSEQGDGDTGGAQDGSPPAPNPQAIPDPLNSIHHQRGDSVELDGVTISYVGLETAGGQLRARFSIEAGSVAGETNVLVPSGEVVDVHASGSDLLTDPFGSSAEPPWKMDIIALRIGERLILFEVGSPH